MGSTHSRPLQFNLPGCLRARSHQRVAILVEQHTARPTHSMHTARPWPLAIGCLMGTMGCGECEFRCVHVGIKIRCPTSL